MKKSELCILLALVFSLAGIYMTEADRQAARIRNSTLRLHIIRRDDSARSQQAKSRVKNSTEKLWPALYCRADSFDNAIAITEENLDYIQKVTDSALEAIGADYTSICSLEKFYFETSQYDDITLPRGQYTALTIRLGDGKGKNWWCILYPDIRTGIGSDYERDSTNTLFETENFRIKLKAVEWFQKAAQLFRDTKTYNHL